MIRCGPQKGEKWCASFHYSHGNELVSSHGLFFYCFSSNESSNCFGWRSLARFSTWLALLFSSPSPPILHTHSPLPLPRPFSVWIWQRSGFYPLKSLSGWIKSQLALVNHWGSSSGIGETFYLWLSFPPVLTWHGIYSCIESIITSTSEIPHSLELRYYETVVRQPIAVSAPNWFILASVGRRWSEGLGEPGSTSDYPSPEFPVDMRGLQTKLNIATLFLCFIFTWHV